MTNEQIMSKADDISKNTDSTNVKALALLVRQLAVKTKDNKKAIMPKVEGYGEEMVLVSKEQYDSYRIIQHKLKSICFYNDSTLKDVIENFYHYGAYDKSASLGKIVEFAKEVSDLMSKK